MLHYYHHMIAIKHKPVTRVFHVSQDLLGNLKVNNKRVGELINGLFCESTDSLEHWGAMAQGRFQSRMIECGKGDEAQAILDYVRSFRR